MSVGIIGQPFGFSFLTVDSANMPVAGLTAYITIYKVDLVTKEKISLEDTKEMYKTSEPGRFTYVYTIPDTFNDKDTIYGLMWANDVQDPTLRYLAEQEVTLVVFNPNSGGLMSRFIR